MPRNHGKLKIQWIVQNGARNATFRKRRATLLEKAKELSILCQVPVAMVVYGPGGDEPPAFFPPDLEEAKAIMQKYLELPESAKKQAQRLDNEGFLRRALKKMAKRFESYKAAARQLEVNLVLNDVSLGRRRGLDGLAPDLAAAVREEVAVLRSLVCERVNSLVASAAAAAPAPVLVSSSSSQVQPLMVAPLAMAAPPPDAPLFVLPPPPPMMLVPPSQAPLVAPSQEPPMVPPFAMAPPPVLVPVPHTLLPAVGDPPALAAADEDDDGFPREGSYLLEVADAILDDGDGSGRQATDDDVDRLLHEHGLESFIKPKNM